MIFDNEGIEEAMCIVLAFIVINNNDVIVIALSFLFQISEAFCF